MLIIENINSIEGKSFEVLMKNREKIESAQMRMDRRFLNFRMKIPEAIRNTATKAIKNQDMALLEKCVETNKQFYNTPMTSRFAEKYNAEFYMKYYKEGKDKEKYLKVATEYIEKYVISKSVESIKKIDEGNYERFMQIYRMGMADSTKDEKFEEMKTLMQKMEARSTASELNNAAWGVIELFDDKETLAKVASWLVRALTLIREPHILDSQAHLLFKLGKKKEAIATEKEAITLAQKQGLEVEKYEKFLAEMKK